MKILFIGDIVGRPGRAAVKAVLPAIKARHEVDLVLANGENLAGGLGLTYARYAEMIEAGIDYFTSGNHVYAKREFVPYLDQAETRVIRPANFPDPSPGRGVATLNRNGKKIQLINLIGRAFMRAEAVDYGPVIEEILANTAADIRLVDFHAEATSEKAILAYSLDGRVTIFLGTHTHVATADERLLPQGTAFQTDVGMVGPLNSSLGAKLENYLAAAKTEERAKYQVATGGPVVFNATLIDVDDSTNRARAITRIQQLFDPRSVAASANGRSPIRP